MMRRPHTFALIALALFAAGCGHQVKESNGVANIYFSTGTYMGMVLIPLALAAGAIALVRIGKGTVAGAALLIGILLLVVVMILPGIWMDRVTLDQQGVWQETGFWWSQTKKGFKTADVREIHIVKKPTGPDRRMDYVWEIHEKGGATRDIDPGDLWVNGTDYLIAKLREREIAVQDNRE